MNLWLSSCCLLTGFGGVVGRPRSTWRERASAALRPVLTSWLARWSWYGWLRTVRNGMPFVTVSCPLLYPLCHATLNTGIPFVGLLRETVTLTHTTAMSAC